MPIIKSGDKLKFRKDLIIGIQYGTYEWEEDDAEFASEHPIVTVNHINYDNTFTVLENENDEDREYIIEFFENHVDLSKLDKDTLFEMMLNNEITEEEYERYVKCMK